jgi:hypothetical protein
LGGVAQEHKVVIDYFLETLGRRNVRVSEVIRLENPRVRSRYLEGSAERIMFHGCRSQENETRILQNGFQVSSSVSGGPNYGTWFAYNASYSDSGFGFSDTDGIKHLFVCVVSEKHVVLDDKHTMRVVGQNCAYPRWLLRYRDICTGDCAVCCSDCDYYSDYGYDFHDDHSDGCEFYIDLKALHEAERVTGALREHRHRARREMKDKSLKRVAQPRKGRKGQPLKRGGRRKVSMLEIA